MSRDDDPTVTHLFPFDNVLAGVLVLLVGFVFHWVGQTLSLFDWDLATRLGLQEKGMLPEHRVYEHAIAVADACIGWIYGVAGIGLLLDSDWGYTLAWVPGVVLVYHAISFWFWTGNQRRMGHATATTRSPMRLGWTAANLMTGLLAIAVAWNAR